MLTLLYIPSEARKMVMYGMNFFSFTYLVLEYQGSAFLV